jgi:microcystin-dependent protein
MDISAANWSEDDNANTAAAPDGAPEGMAPSGVNNVLRAHQGALKRFYNWTNPKITGGSGTAYTLSYAVAPGALVDGMTHLVQFNAVNGYAPTLNVNSLGATPIQYYSAGAWRAVPAALWDADTIFRVAYNSSAGAYRILHRDDSTGDVILTARSAARGGTLLCFGQAVSRTAYAGLFAALGTTYGVGDGSTTFNLPDMRGRVAAGKDDMGGSSAARLSSIIASTTLGGAGGGQTNTANTGVSGNTSGSLSVNATGTQNGDFSLLRGAQGTDGPLVAQNGATSTVVASGSTSGSLFVSASGTSGAFSVVQPALILNYLIRI